jgi:hypothetical protein
MTGAPEWIATEATVTTCRYQSPGLSTLAFGFQTTQKFRITFDYYAHGRLYSGEFQSPAAIPQNERIPITYNPLDPQENSRASSRSGAPSPRRALLAIGIAGSIVLSLLWLAVLRSCN